ncbi:complex I assembly factor TIMMDC1, mitochondrial isoform X2 [Tupaia chinensis]|uniref:complex I assembly factor TIMMDC1, mitochondrial isoform X2 n=1 Tax=Tupaia chinensis TaxID=246437 RepID=UPI000FFC860F|nr:complex I assembly factor TIMMDC1, mitochondrial isoform X2 [Tupaia chinensis]
MEVPPPASRSFLCRALSPFPRVLAADSEALAEDQKLPAYVPNPYYPESGWDRLRELFVKDEQQRTSKELQNIYRAAVSAGIIGWAYGGIPAFIHAKQRYIEQSQAEMYHNRFDAVQSAHRAATRGFIRYGWRWSWRTTVFVTIFNTVNTGLNVYRNKNALSHFVIAGAVTGSLFRINLGLRGLVAGGVIGALLGFYDADYFMCGIISYLSFYDWLISFHMMMSLRFIHKVTLNISFLFLGLHSILLYVYSIFSFLYVYLSWTFSLLPLAKIVFVMR